MTSGNTGECVMTSGNTGECVMTSSNSGDCVSTVGFIQKGSVLIFTISG